MKYIMFTHTDADGIGCAVLGKRIFTENFEYKCISYNNINILKVFLKNVLAATPPKNSMTIFICDLNFDDKEIYQLIDKLYNYGINILQFDHHPESKEFKDFPWMTYSDTKSGTLLFYTWLVKKYFENKNIFAVLYAYKLFVKYINAYDTWTWINYSDAEMKNIRWLNRNIRFYSIQDAVSRYVNNPSGNTFTDSELKTLNKYEKYYMHFMHVIMSGGLEIKTDTFGQTYISMSAIPIIYELTPFIFKKYNVDYVLIINTERKTVGYRSKENTGIARKMAILFNGNGHPDAAGSELTQDWIDFYNRS